MLAALDLPPKKLCIIRLSAIGDACHTVPVVRAMISRLVEQAWSHYMSEEFAQFVDGLIEDSPATDELWTLAANWSSE